MARRYSVELSDATTVRAKPSQAVLPVGSDVLLLGGGEADGGLALADEYATVMEEGEGDSILVELSEGEDNRERLWKRERMVLAAFAPAPLELIGTGSAWLAGALSAGGAAVTVPIADADSLPSLRELVWGEHSGRVGDGGGGGGGWYWAGAAACFAAVFVLGSLQQAKMSSR